MKYNYIDNLNKIWEELWYKYHFPLQWQGNDKSSYPFEVTLLLLSFFISWIEAWFVDFRVLPQENRAKSVLEGKGTRRLWIMKSCTLTLIPREQV